jgi:hypothetical protein
MTDSNILEFKPRPYRTSESTIDAFWCLVNRNEPDRLKAWLEAHPRDQQALYDLWEERQNVGA